MQAYSSTVLALPQIKSECPAAEPLYQKAPLRCEKKLRILFRSGRYAYVKSATKCIISTPKIKKFSGEGAHRPHPHLGGGHPLPRPYPSRHLRRLESVPAARRRRLRRLDPIPPPLLRNPGSAPGYVTCTSLRYSM